MPGWAKARAARRRPPDRSPGALVIGGDYRALGVVRSMGRHGIPTWVVRSPEDRALAATSRYCGRRLEWPDDGDEARASFLWDLAHRHGLQGWVLFPTADATAAFVARRHAVLAEWYRLTTPPWEVFRQAYDKRLTAQLATALGVPQPRTRPLPDRADAERYQGPFPVVLKPSTKPRLNKPAVKAWRADDAAELVHRFDEAAAVTEPGTLLLQELIPGDHDVHFSFAALCEAGLPLVSITAERVRQYPLDFGKASTFVRTVRNARVEDLGRRVLAELRFAGLAEVEFKRDPRDGSYRLLDINARVWGWHTLGRSAGLDFAHLAWHSAMGRPVPRVRVPAGLRWLRLTTDLPAGLQEVRTGRTSATSYVRSLAGPHERPVLAWDDPLPAFAEVPLDLLSKFPRTS
jgi:D-aspartate ligase